MTEVEKIAIAKLEDALEALRAAKPNDRSEADRRYAVAITELEKAIAYFGFWIFQGRE